MPYAWLLPALGLTSCAVAFTTGKEPMPAPSAFQDTAAVPRNEEQRTEKAHADSAPAIGLSLVVGGKPLDAGPLPKPPVPVVSMP